MTGVCCGQQSAAEKTAVHRIDSKTISRILGQEKADKPVSFRIVSISGTELFQLLAQKAELSYVAPADIFPDEKAAPPAGATVAQSLESLLAAHDLTIDSEGPGLAWLLPAAQAKANAAARISARKEGRQLLGDQPFKNMISVPALPATTKARELISLLAQRAGIKISVGAEADRPMLIHVQKKPAGAVLLAVLESLGLKLRSDGSGGFVAVPVSQKI